MQRLNGGKKCTETFVESNRWHHNPPGRAVQVPRKVVESLDTGEVLSPSRWVYPCGGRQFAHGPRQGTSRFWRRPIDRSHGSTAPAARRRGDSCWISCSICEVRPA